MRGDAKSQGQNNLRGKFRVIFATGKRPVNEAAAEGFVRQSAAEPNDREPFPVFRALKSAVSPSQAGRRRFEPGRPLSPKVVAPARDLPSPPHFLRVDLRIFSLDVMLSIWVRRGIQCAVIAGPA